MLHEIETDPIPSAGPALPERAADAPPPTKPASLTGALVQRGRDRGPRLSVVPSVEAEPVPPAAPAPDPARDPVPLVFARPRKAPARPSRGSEALFVVACCAAFFATFLFVLRF